MGPEANDLLPPNHRRSWERNLGVMRLGWAPTAWRSRPQLFLAVGPRRGLECMLRSLVPRRSAYAAEYSSPRRRRGGQANYGVVRRARSCRQYKDRLWAVWDASGELGEASSSRSRRLTRARRARRVHMLLQTPSRLRRKVPSCPSSGYQATYIKA
jgi:hypothetical protein